MFAVQKGFFASHNAFPLTYDLTRGYFRFGCLCLCNPVRTRFFHFLFNFVAQWSDRSLMGDWDAHPGNIKTSGGH